MSRPTVSQEWEIFAFDSLSEGRTGAPAAATVPIIAQSSQIKCQNTMHSWPASSSRNPGVSQRYNRQVQCELRHASRFVAQRGSWSRFVPPGLGTFAMLSSELTLPVDNFCAAAVA